MITNQEIITALRTAATKKDAAELLGISRQTLYERIKRPDFVQELELAAEAEKQVTEAARNSAVNNALEFLNDVVNDNSLFGYTNAERIKAASVILGYSSRA